MSLACFIYRDTGECRFGDSCRFSHQPDGELEEAKVQARAARARNAGICYAFRDGICYL